MNQFALPLRSPHKISAAVVFLSLVFINFNANAACTLTGAAVYNFGSSGSWTVGSNWSTGSFPNSSSTDACVVDGVSTVTISSTNISVNNLQVGSGNEVDSFQSPLSVFGSLINAGTIEVDAGAGSSSLNIAGSNVSLSGGGTVNLTNGAINGNTLTNVDNTIQGAGFIGNGGGLTVVNGGTINGNTTGTLTLNGTGGITNSNGTTGGLLEATNGGTLLIGTNVANTGANITANGTGSTVTVGNNVTITGGTLNTLAGGVLETATSATATLSGVTISSGSTYTAPNSTTTNLVGTITNQGTLQVTATTGSTNLTVAGSNVMLSGGGIVNLSTSSGGGAAINGNNTLTNVDNTIQGTGTIGNGSLTLVNGGTVDANTSSGIGTLTLNGTGGITNNGTFAAENGGKLNVSVPFTNTGTVHAISGTINASQGFTGTTGTARIDTAGNLTIGANSTVGTLIHNGSGASSLNLGNNNITVSTDYVNGNFGAGNNFNKLANVATTGGQILAAGPTPANMEVITGAKVSNGNTTTPTIALGTVHVGDSTTYQIANQGTTSNPSLRGAVQTSVNGGNITGGLLSGSGVTAGNFGPIAPGTSSGNLTVTAASAGSLTGQAIHIANNFSNVPEQTISFTGTVNNYAALAFLQQQGGQGSLTGGGASYLLDFGNILQGSGSEEALLAFLNNNPISEQLFTDLLSSSATITGGSGFSLIGDSVTDLAGGDVQGGFDIGLNTAIAGNFLETLSFDVESSNTSGYDQVIGSVALTLEGQVISSATPVPEPGSLPLLASSLGMLFILFRWQRRRL